MDPIKVDRIERSPLLIVGAGIAGLSAALSVRECTVLARSPVGQGGATRWAQGGIAAAIDAADSAAEHARDTFAAGGGIVDESAAAMLTESGPQTIEWLMELGADFDRDARGLLALSREGGHGRRRVVHAEGDATGAEILRALTAAAQAKHPIAFSAGSRALDFAVADGRVVGVLVQSSEGGRVLHLAGATILATGGACRAYLRTTNPGESVGDGIAMAARAGAELADMEFVQFHPTALDTGLDPMPLLTEALRGEGALLINEKGERFLSSIHPNAELAPRDVVARAIWEQMRAGKRVFLDATSVLRHTDENHFAYCREAAKRAGLDPQQQPLPIAPAAHYHIGGVATDLEGRTSLPGLWAAGETASTGVHGANRLASNSLLEGVVFGRAAARSASQALGDVEPLSEVEVPAGCVTSTNSQDEDLVKIIRQTMWEQVGLMRDEAGLSRALRLLETLRAEASSRVQTRNLHLVAELIAHAALLRKESRGVHFRSDYPTADSKQAARSKMKGPREPMQRIDLDGTETAL